MVNIYIGKVLLFSIKMQAKPLPLVCKVPHTANSPVLAFFSLPFFSSDCQNMVFHDSY